MISNRSTQEIKYISFMETEGQSLDWLDKYLRTLDLNDIPVKSTTPTIFTVKRLSRVKAQEIGVVANQPLSARQQHEVIAHGLKRVENWGRDLDFKIKGAGDRERVEDSTLDAMYAPDLWLELSMVIVKISGLSPLEE